MIVPSLPGAAGGATTHPPGSPGLVAEFQDGAGSLDRNPGGDQVHLLAAIHHFGAFDDEGIARPDVGVDLR
jgi:hypothetical protein